MAQMEGKGKERQGLSLLGLVENQARNHSKGGGRNSAKGGKFVAFGRKGGRH